MDALLKKLDERIEAIAVGLGKAGVLDTDDIIQEIKIGIINAYQKQPTATDSFLLQAGRNYARDRLKTERARQSRYVTPVLSEDGDEQKSEIFDTLPYPNRKGRDAEIREWLEELKNVLTYRQIVILDHILDGWWTSEIADLTKWSIRTIQREFAEIRNEAVDIAHHILDDTDGLKADFKRLPTVYGRAIQLLLF
ncbi:MAG: hypothetical protein AB1349_07980 [Elusimicrobiota bacterium]